MTMNKYIRNYKMRKMLKSIIKNLRETKYHITNALAWRDTRDVYFREKYIIINQLENIISFYEDSLNEKYYNEIFSYEELYVANHDSKSMAECAFYINNKNGTFPYDAWEYLYNMITIGRSKEDSIKKYNKLQEIEKKKKDNKTSEHIDIAKAFIVLIIAIVFAKLFIH